MTPIVNHWCMYVRETGRHQFEPSARGGEICRGCGMKKKPTQEKEKS